MPTALCKHPEDTPEARVTDVTYVVTHAKSAERAYPTCVGLKEAWLPDRWGLGASTASNLLPRLLP